MKKGFLWLLLVILLIVIVLVFLLFKKEDTSWTPLFELTEYETIDANKVESINILRYTEGGVDSQLVEEKEDILRTIRSLSQIKIGRESQTACEDNTTVYIIKQKNEEFTIEIECDNLVMSKNRYQIKR